MQRTSGQGHVDHLFVAENVNTSQPPTEITADWMNAVQEEICAVIEEAGITLTSANNAQLLAAINILIAIVAGDYILASDEVNLSVANSAKLENHSASYFQTAIAQGHEGGFNADMVDGKHASEFVLANEKVIFKAVKSGETNQAITTSTDTKLTGWEAEIDTHAGLTSDKFTVAVPGFYEFNLSALCQPDASSGGAFRVLLYKNGAVIKDGTFRFGGNTTTTAFCQTIIAMSENDYIEAYAWQDTGSAQPASGLKIHTEFSGRRV